MNEQIAQFLAEDAVQIPLWHFVVNLVITAFLSFVLAQLYIRFGRSLSNRRSFAGTFVMIAVTTMVIITIVKSSFALSLGLVGALSIVRFRAAIKEPEELGFLFLCIAIGLGMGANQWKIVLIGFVVIAITVILYGLKGIRKDNQNLYITIGLDNPTGEEVSQVVEILKKHCFAVKLKRLDSSKDLFEASFLVDFDQFEHLDASRAELHSLNENYRLTYLDNKSIS